MHHKVLIMSITRRIASLRLIYTVRSYSFVNRHIGPNDQEIDTMLGTIDCTSLDDMIYKIVPDNIRRAEPMKIGKGTSEYAALNYLKEMAKKNLD